MLGWCGIRGLFREKSVGGKDSSGPMENSRFHARIPDGERLRWGRSLFSFATRTRECAAGESHQDAAIAFWGTVETETTTAEWIFLKRIHFP
jgi:hypothetical protein